MGTGQYDYSIYQALLRIEDLIESVITYLQGFLDVLNFLHQYWMPILASILLLISIFTIVRWVVKL